MLPLEFVLCHVPDVMVQHQGWFHDKTALYHEPHMYSLLLYVLVLEIKGKRKGGAALEEVSSWQRAGRQLGILY